MCAIFYPTKIFKFISAKSFNKITTSYENIDLNTNIKN